jgi:hypothetical protein
MLPPVIPFQPVPVISIKPESEHAAVVKVNKKIPKDIVIQKPTCFVLFHAECPAN